MKQDFSHLDVGGREGFRFDGSAVGRFYTWIRQLSPSPIQEGSGRIVGRQEVNHFEVALLALDYVYRSRGYRYGDPVVLDEVLLNDLSGVFFLDTGCYRQLLSLATKLTRLVSLRDTFAGTSVTLHAPYGVAEI
jgi:hypothetical protein